RSSSGHSWVLGPHDPPPDILVLTWQLVLLRFRTCLRASVGSTEASASLLARVGVVGPKQVSLSVPAVSLPHAGTSVMVQECPSPSGPSSAAPKHEQGRPIASHHRMADGMTLIVLRGVTGRVTLRSPLLEFAKTSRVARRPMVTWWIAAIVVSVA